MNNQFRKLIVYILIALGLGLLFFLVFVHQPTFNTIDSDILIAWNDQEGGGCSVWMIDPINKQTTVSVGQEECNYVVAPTNSQVVLAHIQQHPAIITLYGIEGSDLILEKEISLDGIEITSKPHWAPNNDIFFSAIAEGKEAIYHYHEETDLAEKLIEYEGGMAYEPILSPDGKHIIYWVRDGLSNRYECMMGPCESGYYYLADIEKNTRFDILPHIKNPQPHTHCLAMWSPSGRYVAFQIGCDNFPNQIVIFDVYENKTLTVINPFYDYSGVDLIGWLSDTQLIYRGGVYVSEYNDSFIRHQVLSTETLASQEFADLPYLEQTGTVFPLHKIDWTSNSTKFVGLNRDIVIGEINGQIGHTIPFTPVTGPFQTNYNQKFIWSPSGQKIAYLSAAEPLSRQVIINILNEQGETLYAVDAGQATRLDFGWVTR